MPPMAAIPSANVRRAVTRRNRKKPPISRRHAPKTAMGVAPTTVSPRISPYDMVILLEPTIMPTALRTPPTSTKIGPVLALSMLALEQPEQHRRHRDNEQDHHQVEPGSPTLALLPGGGSVSRTKSAGMAHRAEAPARDGQDQASVSGDSCFSRRRRRCHQVGRASSARWSR